MNESAIAVRYARAVFSLAKEKEIIDSLKNDMELIHGVCKDSADFNLLLKSPVIRTSQKTRLISQIFKNKVHPVTLNFLLLITRNNRETFIQAISRDALDFIRREKNIKPAILTTAIAIDKAFISEIEKIMEKELGGKIELTSRVNPDIIGGLILRVGDKQLDASIKTQLRNIKQDLLKKQV
ncbi:MAG TPA: ATP synthase F1 subunit delta [Tangfeifania sp.]|nr:ATP synthase F1 subunit delta [Tangfeifania sp.]